MEERFKALRIVGRGAGGTVRLCKRLADDKLVIVKQIELGGRNKHERTAAIREVEILKKLQHPNIVALVDHFVEDGSLMIVMEYADSGSLFDFLSQRQELLPEATVLRLFVQIAIGLNHIHDARVFHRDLKTHNIFLHDHRRMVKIGDFGISKLLDTHTQRAQSVVGTPAYTSPEVLQAKNYGAKSDVWSLGCVLYEMLTLRQAFEAPTFPALLLKVASGTWEPVPDIYSEELQSLVSSMLTVDADRRPSLRAVLAAPIVQRALIDLMTDVRPQPVGTAPSPRHGSNHTQCQQPMLDKAAHHHHHHHHQQQQQPQPQPQLKQQHEGGQSISTAAPQAPERIREWSRAIVARGSTLNTRHITVEEEFKIVSGALGRGRIFAVTDRGAVRLWRCANGEQKRKEDRETRMASAHRQEEQGKNGAYRQGRREAECDELAGGTMPVPWLPCRLRGFERLRVKRIACGQRFAALITDRGIAMTFGKAEGGVLGQGDNTSDLAVPTIVPGLLGYEATDVSCGPTHVTLATTDNHVFAWGSSSTGTLGCGADTVVTAPRLILPASGQAVARVRCGLDATCVITTNGGALVAGSNRFGRLGLDMKHKRVTLLTQLELPHVIRHAAFGADHAAFITDDDRCITCGDNTFGQLGRPDAKCGPAPVCGLEGEPLVMAACGSFFTAVVTAQQQVYAFGRMRTGEGGDEDVGDNRTGDDVNQPLTEMEVCGREVPHLPRVVPLDRHVVRDHEGRVQQEQVVVPPGRKRVVEMHACGDTLLWFLNLRQRLRSFSRLPPAT